MFDELKKSMNNAFGTTVDNLVMESLINDDIRMIMMESDEALEEACKSCGKKKGCKEGADVDSTNDNIKETGSASPAKAPVGEGCGKKKGKQEACEEADVDSTNKDIEETGSASPEKAPVGESVGEFDDEDFEEVQEAFIDCEYEITMEGFKPDKHKVRIAKIENKVNSKLAKMRNEAQRGKLLNYLNDQLQMMEMIKKEFPEEKGQGLRVVKGLISKVKSAKIATPKAPVKESFEDIDDFMEDVEEALTNFEYETTMEAFTMEKHLKELEKITTFFEKKIAKIKTEKQKARVIKRLENELVYMQEVHEDTPEEKGRGERVIKKLLVKAKRVKVPTKESVEESTLLEGSKEVDSTNKEIKETGAASPEEGPEADDIDRLIADIPEDEGDDFDEAYLESLIESLPGYEF